MLFCKDKLRTTKPLTSGKTSFLSLHLNTCTTSKPETQMEFPINDILRLDMSLNDAKTRQTQGECV